MSSGTERKREKKKILRFYLTPRPQKDPLAADNDAPPNILVPKDEDQDIEEIRNKLSDFDAKVFASKERTKVGMLERAHAAAGMTFDSDLLKAMSQEFDYEDPNNMLDDDFFEQAGGLIEDDGELPDVDLFNDESKVAQDDLSQEFDDLFDDEDEEQVVHDARSIYTGCSMTSSVMRRSKGLQQIDEHFETLYEKEYADDTEIGALDLNDVQGEEVLSDIDQIRQLKREVKCVRKRNHGDDYQPEIVSDHHKDAIVGDGPAEDLVEVEVNQRENRIDCESILTYNSNLYNHPKLIVEPRKRCSTQDSAQDKMSIDGDDTRSRSAKTHSIASSRATILTKLSNRPANETSEERKLRKKALKEYRNERRQERKQNQKIFQVEQANLVKQQRANVATLKLA